jgi:hypothetical protein
VKKIFGTLIEREKTLPLSITSGRKYSSGNVGTKKNKSHISSSPSSYGEIVYGNTVLKLKVGDMFTFIFFIDEVISETATFFDSPAGIVDDFFAGVLFLAGVDGMSSSVCSANKSSRSSCSNSSRSISS